MPEEKKETKYNPYGFLYDIRLIPCMRNTLLNATGTGIALGVHSFYRHRIPMNATLTGLKAAMAVSVITWVTCRLNFHHRNKQIVEIMKNQDKYLEKRRGKSKSLEKVDSPDNAK
mmetsp:Transcript_8902/g.13294  ORF Transcript_8902/g.13294 Transcript_8902/m.13294 type:complete len:115 (-) Transcript_8902:172-516(-)|eukprot:CAMPEP_0167760806 /NCGR_PEP_ID=MMETSP0110_2-20121227/11793_1 /TAXON_ID=629695 /ORGANISM="Gymnochlora sp., Strain CCMP2014" /LENGTH=114 /DNA_ID=CAMNT_0007647363 /DNA_START=32 /DNA_END=376 /DNA_ORIENTATION=-